MANVYATKTGNWSDTSVWNTAALPTSSDDVYSNTYTVTIDQDVTVKSIRNTAATSITAGGGFACSTARTINTSGGSGFVTGAANLLTLSNGAGVAVVLVGAVTGGTSASGVCVVCGGVGSVDITGAVAAGRSSSYGVSVTAAGTITITGAVTGASSDANTHGVYVNALATVTVTGNVTGGAGQSGSGSAYGIFVQPAGTVSVTGDVTGGGGASCGGIGSGAASTITVTGKVTGGSNLTAVGVSSTSSSGSVTATGTLTASTAPAISGGAAFVVTGPFISASGGVLPIYVNGTVKLSPITNNEFRFAKTVSGTSSLYSSDVNSGAPVATDVRNGTSYAGGLLTGSLKVPSPAYVAAGVETDATVGTYNPAADVWAYATSSATTAGSMGERLKNAATVDSTGAQLASYGS